MARLDPVPATRLPKLPSHRVGSAGIALGEPEQENLRRAMAARHWDHEALAEVAGVSRQSITNVLTGKRVSSDLLIRIAHAISQNPPDLSVQQLLEGELR